MSNTQLEFNINDLTKEQLEIEFLKKAVEILAESQEKVRKKLFAENGILKKRINALEEEVKLLREEEKKNFEFEYISDDSLFNLKEA